MPVSDDFLTAGLKVTGNFEDSTDPLGAVSGNFDGMGISLGVLQWNIGSNSLQPLVKAIKKPAVMATMPRFGEDLWNACNTTVTQGLAIVRAWQSNNKLPKNVFNELKAFVRSQPFQDQQLKTAHKVGDRAWSTTVAWAQTTKAEFCWFFDIYTQNGGLKTVTPQTVRTFISNHGAAGADHLICDWLASRPSTDSGARDAQKNAQLWRDNVPDSAITLFVASYLRAMLAKPQWRTDVLNRKGTVAVGSGWVHGKMYDLTPIIS
jgi:hypothetical protein